MSIAEWNEPNAIAKIPNLITTYSTYKYREVEIAWSDGNIYTLPSGSLSLMMLITGTVPQITPGTSYSITINLPGFDPELHFPWITMAYEEGTEPAYTGSLEPLVVDLYNGQFVIQLTNNSNLNREVNIPIHLRIVCM